MNLQRIGISIRLTLRQLLRRRITLLLLLVIPSVFYWVVYYTTTQREVFFKLSSISEDTLIEVSERSESMVFIGVAAVGFLASFMGMNLVQKNAMVHRRLVLCGYRSWEIFVSIFAVLALTVLLLAVYVGGALYLFFDPEDFFGVVLGFFAAGMVYGSYGILTGAFVRGELEGILLIVLLANIDAGWLQNPLFYEGAQHQEFIRYLPAYYPLQLSLTTAFSDFGYGKALGFSSLYAAGLMLVGLFFYHLKMRIFK